VTTGVTSTVEVVVVVDVEGSGVPDADGTSLVFDVSVVVVVVSLRWHPIASAATAATRKLPRVIVLFIGYSSYGLLLLRCPSPGPR